MTLVKEISKQETPPSTKVAKEPKRLGSKHMVPKCIIIIARQYFMLLF